MFCAVSSKKNGVELRSFALIPESALVMSNTRVRVRVRVRAMVSARGPLHSPGPWRPGRRLVVKFPGGPSATGGIFTAPGNFSGRPREFFGTAFYYEFLRPPVQFLPAPLRPWHAAGPQGPQTRTTVMLCPRRKQRPKLCQTVYTNLVLGPLYSYVTSYL